MPRLRHRPATRSRTGRLGALLLGGALVAAAGVVAATPATAAAPSVALVGDLQSELGCSADWQPACAATELAAVGGTSLYRGTFDVPAGDWSFKVALNDSWDVNYGAGGALDGDDMPLLLAGPAKITFSYDDTSHQVSFTPVVDEDTTPADASLARASLRASLTRERFYFVMADRFANGSTANDKGGLTGGPLSTGLDPTAKGFYHGGDLRGITAKLDYIKGLGTTAIWLTPSFKNKPVQGAPGQESAGYHGYWITDFTQIDPHLGTNADMTALVDAAHAKGMKVFFDIITNHTADVIGFEENKYTYRSKKAYPYRTAAGTEFDDRDYVSKPASAWPTLDPAVSFPYTPVVTDAEKDVKVPSWLNDVTLYHNRGDSTYAGESSTYGDFAGLDDLFTERPEVVKGMGDIYKKWVDFGIDGFRIDTVKHVNLEFWQQFVPDILAEAKAVGNDDFFAFGEVYDGNPAVMSQYTTAGKLQATLDFGFQQQGVDFAKGNKASVLADFFAKDDWYTDTDSNAYQLPTFLGNHDMGRASMFLKKDGQSEAEHLKRVEFANSLMFTSRGNPVTYYGDEQGFVSTGGDQAAREDMFASKVDLYNTETVLGGPEGSRDRYDTGHPLYRHVAALSALRATYPALADGAQVARLADDTAGVFAFSRIGRNPQKEYLVVANNSTSPQKVTVDTWTTSGLLKPLFGSKATIAARKDGKVTVTVPGLSVAVWGATAVIDRTGAAPTVETVLAEGGAHGRTEVKADVTTSTFAQTTFYWRPVGATTWNLLGTDDNAPFRVFHDVSGIPVDTPLEYRAVVKDAGGRVAGDSSTTQVVAPPKSTVPENGDPAASQPTSVSVAGTLDTELGCPEDWMPSCPKAFMTLDGNDKIWKKTATLPEGPYAYKAALDGTWTENYGAGGVRDGSNIDVETADGTVTFYYDPRTHWVTSDEQDPIITVPGSFQSELGCSDDWDPACMRPWLQDKDGDGVYALITTRIPAGTWQFKVAHGLSFTESYPKDDLTVTVPADGAQTTFLYDKATHEVTVTSE